MHKNWSSRVYQLFASFRLHLDASCVWRATFKRNGELLLQYTCIATRQFKYVKIRNVNLWFETPIRKLQNISVSLQLFFFSNKKSLLLKLYSSQIASRCTTTCVINGTQLMSYQDTISIQSTFELSILHIITRPILNR